MIEINLSLIASYLVDYSINATFSTSVGTIYSIDEKSSGFFLGHNGEPVISAIKDALLPMRYKTSELDETKLAGINLTKEGTFKSFKQVSKKIKDIITNKYDA